MTVVDISFHVPEQIARGLASGEYELFGGVVRGQGGRVVKMLEPVAKDAARAAKRNPMVAVVAVAVVALAGGVIFASTRLTKKARLTRQLAAVDQRLRSSVTSPSTARLSREQLSELRLAINEFLSSATKYENVTLTIEPRQLHDLRLFAEALRSFSSDLTSRLSTNETAPLLPESHEPTLVPILVAISEQLQFQQRHWPGSA